MKLNKGATTLVLMMILTIITQIISLYKSMLMAKYFGTTIEVGAFNFVNNISVFIFGMVGAAIATVVIPSLVRKDYKAISIFLNYLYLFCVISSLVIILFKYAILKLISGISDVKFINFAADILPIILLSNLVLSLSSFMVAVFQVNNGFNYPKIIVLLINLGLVICLLYFPKMSVAQFAAISSTANITNLLLLFIDKKHSIFAYSFSFDHRNKEFREMTINVLPIFVANGAYQISLLVDIGLSSRISLHNITILSYSTQIAGMLSTLFVANLMSYIYPKVVQMINRNYNNQDLSTYFRKLSCFLFSTMFLVALCFLFFGNWVINLLFVHGQFSASDGVSLYWCLLILVFSLPFNAVRDLAYRVFYAYKNTKEPFYSSVVSTLSNIIFSILFASLWGLNGIVLGSLVGAIISTLCILWRLNKKQEIIIWG